MSQLLVCPICQENYDPNTLPYADGARHGFHTVCTGCLQGLYKNVNFFECPMCRQRNDVRFHDIPKNRDILEFIEYMKSSRTNGDQIPNSQTAPSSSSDSTSSSLPYPQGASSFPSAPVYELPVTYQTSNINRSNNQHEWNEANYFRSLFEEIDHNHDGSINFFELYEALKKGQANSQFDPNTAKILLQKYDSNHDDEINFDEFHNLFFGINEQFNEFLDIDTDASGTIEKNELNRLLVNRHINFSGNFFNFLFDEIFKRTGSNRITFDIYVRVIARLDKLVTEYRSRTNNNINKNQQNFENYVKSNFFSSF